jgi:hypothetical protein
VVEARFGRMKQFLHNIFLSHWQRKILSLFFAIGIWLFVNQSLLTTRTFTGVPIRISHLPSDQTIEGLEPSGYLRKRLTLTLSGNKQKLESLSSQDLEVVLNAIDRPSPWNVLIEKKQLLCLNSGINLTKIISKIQHSSLSLQLTPLSIEKIPILISKPVGKAPSDYLFLNVWPQSLTLTVRGPSSLLKRLKKTGQHLTFNLSDIPLSDLESLPAHGDSISFPVPAEWKKVLLPALSDIPLDIDDPEAQHLRIDFLRKELLPLKTFLPIRLFQKSEDPYSFAQNQWVSLQKGVAYLSKPLFIKGVSRTFLQIVQPYLELILSREEDQNEWSVSLQLIHPKILEDRYVALLLDKNSNICKEEQLPQEEFLRKRFCQYRDQLELYYKEKPLRLKIESRNKEVWVSL